MDKMSRKRYYLFISSAIFSCFGLFLILQSIAFGDLKFTDVGNSHQVAQDWAKQPFVGVTVTDDDSCPNKSELLIFRMWQGTKLWCVCSKLMGYHDYEGECIEKYDRDHYAHNCIELPPLNPAVMGQFDGKRVCGIRGGDAFYEVTRPEPNGQCPEDTEPCSSKTSV